MSTVRLSFHRWPVRGIPRRRRCGGGSGLTVVVAGFWAVLAGGATSVCAQATSGAPADAAMDELRRRIPAGERDDRILDTWIGQELAALEGAEEMNRLEAATTFRDRFRAQIANPENTPEFNGRFAARAAAGFQARLSDCQSVPPEVARVLAWVLGDFNHVGTMEGLAAGLGCREWADVRYLCAKAYARLGPKFAVDRLLTEKALGVLRGAGRAETDGVVVGAIYHALQFPDRTDGAVATMVDILTARTQKRRRQQLPVCDGGELALFEFLLKNPPPSRSLSERLVRELAVTLRLDIERLGQEDVGDAETAKLATSIDLCEALLAKIVQPPADAEPHVRQALKKPQEERLLELQIELNKWIGTKQTPGVLSDPPWEVPAGAP